MKKMVVLASGVMFASVTAANAAPPHYDVAANFDDEGQLTADVTVTLSDGESEKSFLLSNRFALQPIHLPSGVSLTVEPVSSPMPALNKLAFRFVRPVTKPVKLRFRYEGPIVTEFDSKNPPLRPEGFELFVDHMWFPVGADIQTRFSVDAEINGLAPDLVVVAQGDVIRTPKGVKIHRKDLDVDLPLVAMRGLKRADVHGVEFYSRDLSSQISMRYMKHAEGAARYLEGFFGPLPEKVRMAQVWRPSAMGYARAAYTVISESGRDGIEVEESSPARFVAHEIAHAWWKLASPLGDDFWLVESTAEYMAMRYVEHAFGPEELSKFMVRKREAARDAGAVMGHGRPNRTQLYIKGPLLLDELEKQIGRPAMDRLMVAMAREPVHTTPIFLQHLTDIVDANVARNFAKALAS